MGADDDGLKWLLELDVKQDDALSFLKTLDKMQSSLKGTASETDKVEHASGRAAHGHKKHGEEADGLRGIFGRLIHQGLEPFLHKAKEIAEFEFIRRFADKIIEAPGELIEKVKELGEEMINSAAKAERTEKSFGLMFGHEGAEEMLDYINKIRRSTEFTAETLEGAVIGLGKIGFKGEGLGRALSAAQDLAALDPDKAGGFSAALFGLEQAKRTGMVNNRTLRPLGIGENDFLKELSKRTGKDLGTLKKQLAAGKIDTEESLETLYSMITRKTGKKLGGAGVDMSKTLGAELTHLGELPELFFKKLAKSPGLEVLKTELGKLLDGLDPESPNGRRIFGALENVFKTIGDLMKTFDLASVVTTAIDALELFTMGFLDLLSHIPGATGDKAAFTLNEMRRRKEQNHRDDAERTDMATRGTTPEFEDAADMADLEAAEKTGALVADGFAKGMKSGMPDVADTAAKLGTVASDATSKSLKIQSPSRVFAEFGRMTAAGFVEGIDASAASVDAAVGQMFAAPKASTAGLAGSGVTVHVGGITVQVSVGSGASAEAASAIANEVARAVESVVPGALQSALANIALQGGAAS